jgi:hypothetical protein
MAGTRAEAAKIAGGGPSDVAVEIFESTVVELVGASAKVTTKA